MKNKLPYVLFVVLSVAAGFCGGHFAWAQNPTVPTWMTPINNGWVSLPDANDATAPQKKYEISIFRDDSNGNLVYVSQTGSIAVVHPTRMPLPAPAQAAPSTAGATPAPAK